MSRLAVLEPLPTDLASPLNEALVLHRTGDMTVWIQQEPSIRLPAPNPGEGVETWLPYRQGQGQAPAALIFESQVLRFAGL